MATLQSGDFAVVYGFTHYYPSVWQPRSQVTSRLHSHPPTLVPWHSGEKGKAGVARATARYGMVLLS